MADPTGDGPSDKATAGPSVRPDQLAIRLPTIRPAGLLQPFRQVGHGGVAAKVTCWPGVAKPPISSAMAARSRAGRRPAVSELVSRSTPTARPIKVRASVAAHSIGRESGDQTDQQQTDADLRFEEPVSSWQIDAPGNVRVVTAKDTYVADRLVIAPGAWASRLLQSLDVPVRVERRVMYWFAPQGGTAPFAPDRHPVYVWEDCEGGDIYGFPALDGADSGAKVAFHAKGSLADPDRRDRVIHPEEVEAMRAYLRPRITALAGGRFLRGAACTYTLTRTSTSCCRRTPTIPRSRSPAASPGTASSSSRSSARSSPTSPSRAPQLIPSPRSTPGAFTAFRAEGSCSSR